MRHEMEKTVAFEASPLRMWLLALLSLGMTALSLAVAVPMLSNIAPGSFGQFAGWLGAVFFGLGTVFIVRQALLLRGPVVTLAPEGIRDIRVSTGFVPWHVIESLGTWEHSRQKFLASKCPTRSGRRLVQSPLLA